MTSERTLLSKVFTIFILISLLTPLLTSAGTERDFVDRTPRVSREVSRADEQTQFLTNYNDYIDEVQIKTAG